MGAIADLSDKVDGYTADLRKVFGTFGLAVVWLLATLSAVAIGIAAVGAGDLLTSFTSNSHVAGLVAKITDPIVAAFAFLVLVVTVYVADKGIRLFRDA